MIDLLFLEQDPETPALAKRMKAAAGTGSTIGMTERHDDPRRSLDASRPSGKPV
jgi:hypothetical protein